MGHTFVHGSWLRDDGIFADEACYTPCSSGRHSRSPTPSFRSHRAKYTARSKLQGISNRHSRRRTTEGDELYNALCLRHVSINGSTTSLPLEIPQAMGHTFVRDSWLRDDGIFADEACYTPCSSGRHSRPPLHRHSAATARSIRHGARSKESQAATVAGEPLKETNSTMLCAVEASPLRRHSAATAQSIWHGACSKESQTAGVAGAPLKETNSTMLCAVDTSPLRRHSAATARSIRHGARSKESQAAGVAGAPLKETNSTMLCAVDTSPSMAQPRLCH